MDCFALGPLIAKSFASRWIYLSNVLHAKGIELGALPHCNKIHLNMSLEGKTTSSNDVEME